MKEKLTTLIFIICIGTLAIGFVSNHEKGWKKDFWKNYDKAATSQGGITAALPSLISAVEKDVDEHTFQKEQFIDFFGLSQKILDKRVMEDAGYGVIYKTEFGQLCFGVPEKDITGMAEKTAKLSDELAAEGIRFLYVQAPYKLPPESNQLPRIGKDHSNENADNFIAKARELGVDVYDLRKDFFNSELTQNELFFNTDHHWTIEGAFHATGLISKKLNDSYGFAINKYYSNTDNFRKTEFTDFFLGALGRRTGKMYSGLDDFTIIMPDFETSIHYYQRNNQHVVEKEGNFNEVLLEYEAIDTKAPATENRYAVYPGDHEELVLHNNNVDTGSVLLIKDSFGLPVYSFMTLGLQEVRALDLRLFTGSIVEYAKEHRPDIVILMYNADGFEDLMFDFEKKN